MSLEKSHTKALDELREAQIALARAWGRGNTEAEDAAVDAGADIGAKFQGADDSATERQQKSRRRADTGLSEASTTLSDESTFSESSHGTRGGSQSTRR